MLHPYILFLLYDDVIGTLKSLISCVKEMFSLIILESKHDVLKPFTSSLKQQHLVMKGPSLNPRTGQHAGAHDRAQWCAASGAGQLTDPVSLYFL